MEVCGTVSQTGSCLFPRGPPCGGSAVLRTCMPVQVVGPGCPQQRFTCEEQIWRVSYYLQGFAFWEGLLFEDGKAYLQHVGGHARKTHRSIWSAQSTLETSCKVRIGRTQSVCCLQAFVESQTIPKEQNPDRSANWWEGRWFHKFPHVHFGLTANKRHGAPPGLSCDRLPRGSTYAYATVNTGYAAPSV